MERAFDLEYALVDPAPVLLRPVNTHCVEYLELVQDLREDGHFGNSILVRPMPEGRYEVVDGMYRWTAAGEARLRVIQAIVREMTDEEVLIWQIKTNATRKDTDPIEYAKHIERLRRLHPGITLKELAAKLGKHRRWVSEVLSLNKLIEPAANAVRRGEITVGNGRLLAKLKPFLQPNFIKLAKHESFREFRLTIAEAVNDYREAVKMGKIDEFYNQEVRPFLRPMREVRHELETWENAGVMIMKNGCKTPLDGWKLAIQWMMNVDAENLERRRKKRQRKELRRLESDG